MGPLDIAQPARALASSPAALETVHALMVTLEMRLQVRLEMSFQMLLKMPIGISLVEIRRRQTWLHM